VRPWVQDIESLEAINQDELVRQVVVRLAGVARDGRLPGFVAAVGADAELDAETKATVLELARDETLLLARGLHARDRLLPLGGRYNALGSGD
jgi:hypothetical protein